MSEPGSSRRGRGHDAEGTREAILNAAEIVFAEHGFDGARVDAIAAQAGYNKSLIFQYFGDKQSLYVEVMRRADSEMSVIQKRLLESLRVDMAILSNPRKFKDLLEMIVGVLFDYQVEHPRLVRMLSWEQAEGWETYKKILSQFNTEDDAQFEAIFRVASEVGLLRSDLSPLFQITLALQVCQTYLSWKPLYEIVFPQEDFSSPEAQARLRDHIIRFIVAGIMLDSANDKGDSP